MVTVILGTLNKLSLDINNLFLSPKMLSDVIKMIYKDELSNSKAKSLIYDAIKEEKDPISLIKEMGITQINDNSLIENYIEEALIENVNAISDYKNGKDYVVNFIVGQVMKKTKGQANPVSTANLVKEILNKK